MAAGLEAVKCCGGRALVQDPGEAVAQEMPRNALHKAPVDAAAPPAQLGKAIAGLVREPAGPCVEISGDLRLEVDIAGGGSSDSDVVRAVVDPAPLTCPSCGGVMSSLQQGKLLRHRCRVGHAMGAEGWRTNRKKQSMRPCAWPCG